MANATKPAAKKTAGLKILYVGNFEPEHSTENHVRRALEHNGHTVFPFQENDLSLWDAAVSDTIDLVLWTHTGYPELATPEMRAKQHVFLRRLRNWKPRIPIVGYHLDIWWGLPRAIQVEQEPFFDVDLLITADGGHAHRWEIVGVNHHWMPPAVSLAECELGSVREEFVSPLAFVGSHDGGYHPEHQHRHELVQWLKANYRSTIRFWPERGMPAVRGKDLRDLYASTSVLIGDSCFAGQIANYWSDRIPETLGRGGYLIHPMVTGMEQQGFNQGVMGLWEAGDWDGLGSQIEFALEYPAIRQDHAEAGRKHVMENHTYEKRMQQLVELLQERNLL